MKSSILVLSALLTMALAQPIASSQTSSHVLQARADPDPDTSNVEPSAQDPNQIRTGSQSPSHRYKYSDPMMHEPNPRLTDQFRAIDNEIDARVESEARSTADDHGRAGKVIRLLSYCVESRVSASVSCLALPVSST